MPHAVPGLATYRLTEKHLFSCPLTMRGGPCTCLPRVVGVGAPETPPGHTLHDQRHLNSVLTHAFACPLVTRGGICDCRIESDARRAARIHQREVANRQRADALELSADRLSEHGRDDIAAIARDRALHARARTVA